MRHEVEKMLRAYDQSDHVDSQSTYSNESLTLAKQKDETNLHLARTAVSGVYGGAGNGDNQQVVRRQMRRTHPS